MKLLLADDDGDQLELRSLTLTNAGYEVCTAWDLDSALRVAAKEAPDAAIVDLRLPTEEAGLRLIRSLKDLDTRIRIIVLTGANPKKLEKWPGRALVEAVFTKGGGSKQLIRHLKESAT